VGGRWGEGDARMPQSFLLLKLDRKANDSRSLDTCKAEPVAPIHGFQDAGSVFLLGGLVGEQCGHSGECQCS